MPFPSPFVFPSGTACRNFDEFCLGVQQNWHQAVELMQKGHLERFLAGMGRLDLAQHAVDAAKYPDPDRALDQLIARIPSKILATPKLKVEPAEVRLGPLQVGVDNQVEIDVMNDGLRLLYGSIVSDCKWLNPGDQPGSVQKLIQCQKKTTVKVHVRGNLLRAGLKPMEGNLIIESNGGQANVRVLVDVSVIPFWGGCLAGATTPRDIATLARKNPQESTSWFEQGGVAGWYAVNGWTYPVQGPQSTGMGAIQQFFEALGLTKPVKCEVIDKSVALRGGPGERVVGEINVRGLENRPIYIFGTTFVPWLSVGQAKLKGNKGVLPIEVVSVPSNPGEVLQTTVRVTANGGQTFDVPVSLKVEHGSYRPTWVDRDTQVGGGMRPPPPPLPPPLPWGSGDMDEPPGRGGRRRRRR
ncbi:MAG: hypothetical protein U0793_03520 [Gemmataceae bacterium]